MIAVNLYIAVGQQQKTTEIYAILKLLYHIVNYVSAHDIRKNR